MENELNEKPRMHHDARAPLFQFARQHREKPTQAEAVFLIASEKSNSLLPHN